MVFLAYVITVAVLLSAANARSTGAVNDNSGNGAGNQNKLTAPEDQSPANSGTQQDDYEFYYYYYDDYQDSSSSSKEVTTNTEKNQQGVEKAGSRTPENGPVSKRPVEDRQGTQGGQNSARKNVPTGTGRDNGQPANNSPQANVPVDNGQRNEQSGSQRSPQENVSAGNGQRSEQPMTSSNRETADNKRRNEQPSSSSPQGNAPADSKQRNEQPTSNSSPQASVSPNNQGRNGQPQSSSPQRNEQPASNSSPQASVPPNNQGGNGQPQSSSSQEQSPQDPNMSNIIRAPDNGTVQVKLPEEEEQETNPDDSKTKVNYKKDDLEVNTATDSDTLNNITLTDDANNKTDVGEVHLKSKAGNEFSSLKNGNATNNKSDIKVKTESETGVHYKNDKNSKNGVAATSDSKLMIASKNKNGSQADTNSLGKNPQTKIHIKYRDCGSSEEEGKEGTCKKVSVSFELVPNDDPNKDNVTIHFENGKKGEEKNSTFVADDNNGFVSADAVPQMMPQKAAPESSASPQDYSYLNKDFKYTDSPIDLLAVEDDYNFRESPGRSNRA